MNCVEASTLRSAYKVFQAVRVISYIKRSTLCKTRHSRNPDLWAASCYERRKRTKPTSLPAEIRDHLFLPALYVHNLSWSLQVHRPQSVDYNKGGHGIHIVLLLPWERISQFFLHFFFPFRRKAYAASPKTADMWYDVVIKTKNVHSWANITAQ